MSIFTQLQDGVTTGAAEDTRALDEIETFLNDITAGGTLLGGPEVTIFYLKHETAGAESKAAVMGEIEKFEKAKGVSGGGKAW